MADAVVGAIASGAGLASLAIQIFESIQKLHQLYTSIRDAPKEIHDLLNELDLLADVLRDFTTAANSPLQPLSAPSSTQRRAANHCTTVLNILHDITKEFDAKIKVSASNKIMQWASIRVALRRKKLAELRSHIESAKLTLLLTVQSHLSALVSRGLIHPGTFQGVSVKENDDAKTVVCGTENPERISSGITKRSCRASRRMRRIKTYNIGVGTLSLITTQSQPDDKQTTSESEWRIGLTPWFLSTAISIITQRSLGKVKRTLETCCLVPPDAEIFSVCAMGDNAAIRRLIADGKASPFDVTFEGVTPLAVSLLNTN
jgi:N-terminal domain on NACHT_NTPase and P-loop NTPases